MKNRCIFLLVWTVLMTAAHAAEPQTQQLETAVSRMWQAMSHAPGVAADVATLQQLLHPNAVVAGARPGKPLSQQSGSAFLQSLQQVRPKGFYECEIGREVRVYGDFATVLSLVESRPDPAQQQADFTGINSLQWYFDGKQWQLIALYYYLEQKPGDLQHWPLAADARRAPAGTCL
jgi:hypothetical protein